MSTITAGTTSGTALQQAGDTTGTLVFKTNDSGSGGTTALTLGTDQSVTFGGAVASPYTGFKNRIINGAMVISQRTAINTNVAVGTGTSGTFGPDRFSGYTGTASLWNISQVSTNAYDFPYALRLQRIAAQTSTSAIYLRQLIETNNCIDLAGQSVALSFYATAGANYSGGAATVSVFTGTAADQGTTSLNTGAWTGAATPINSTFTPTTTRTKFTFTGTFGSTIQEVAFSISWAGSGTAGANDYIDITGVQLEKGSTATSFDYRPYGTELALCQRYYEKSCDQQYVAGVNTSLWGSGNISPCAALAGSTAGNVAGGAMFMPFKAEKRAVPTIVAYDYDGTANAVRVIISTDAKKTGVTAFGGLQTTGVFQFISFSSASATAVTTSSVINFVWTASAEL